MSRVMLRQMPMNGVGGVQRPREGTTAVLGLGALGFVMLLSCLGLGVRSSVACGVPPPPQIIYKVGGAPAGGGISDKPGTEFRQASNPVWKCNDQFLSGNTVPLTASFDSPFDSFCDEDEEWYAPPYDVFIQDVNDQPAGTGCDWDVDGFGSASGTFADQYALAPGLSVGSLGSGESGELSAFLFLRDAAMYFDDPPCLATGSPHSADVRVYDTNLTRDIANVGVLNAGSTGALCGAGAHHAYDGSNNGAVACPYPFGGNPRRIFDIGNTSMDDISKVQLGQVSRGTVVIYGGGPQGGGSVSHIETFTGTTGATWGANTPASPGAGHWATSSVGLYLEVHGPGGLNNMGWIDIYD
jgi:hypothetical protein